MSAWGAAASPTEAHEIWVRSVSMELPPPESLISRPILGTVIERRLLALGKRRGASERELQEACEELRLWSRIQLPPDRPLFEWIQELRGGGYLDRHEPVYRHELAVEPNDPELGAQRSWLQRVGAFAAWDSVQADGSKALVAVVDGGTDWRHPDLEANCWINPVDLPGNGIDEDGNGFVDDHRGWNFVMQNGDPTGNPATPASGAHGTQMAGILGAVSDNAIGIAGLGWRQQFLAVNASHPEIDNAISFGFEGLLYAAATGARIINASWGRRGRHSDLEAQVIALLRSLDCVVVAAAGNWAELNRPFYPAWYPGVLSVASLDLADSLSFFSNRGSWVDLAAPGRRIRTTQPGGGYILGSGTSAASAIVSGAAALLLHQEPNLSSAAVRQRLRWTSDPLSTDVEVGAGRLRIDRALQPGTQPGLAISSLEFSDEDGDGFIEGGELLELSLGLGNELAEANSPRVTFRSLSPALLPLDDSVRLGRLLPGQYLNPIPGLRAYVDQSALPGELVLLEFELEVGGRMLRELFPVELRPQHLDLRGSGLEFSISTLGRLGYNEPTRSGDAGGLGLRLPGGDPLCLGGTILLGAPGGPVSEAVVVPSEDFAQSDFRSLQGLEYQTGDPPRADLELGTTIRDAASPVGHGIQLQIRGMAWQSSRWGGIQILEVVAHALDGEARSGLRMGILLDLELSGFLDESDQLHFDETEGFLLARPGRSDLPWVGLAVLDSGSGATWLHDIRPEVGSGEPEDPWLYDRNDVDGRPSDATLWELMDGRGPALPSPVGGVAALLSTASFDLGEGESRKQSFAIFTGSDEGALREQFAEARVAFAALSSGEGRAAVGAPHLLVPSPHPISAGGQIRFNLPRDASVELVLHDIRGRRVRELVREQLSAGFHSLPFDGRDGDGQRLASGLYLVKLRAGGQEVSGRVLLIR